ncbi:MAG: 8-amino-7-oxononanoate synthase [Candidatus Omnitrophota bacterium]
MKTDFIARELDGLRSMGLYRELSAIEGKQSAKIRIKGKDCINLCSNNYLGLANNPRMKKAAIEAVSRYGCGSGASRLVAGSMRLHEELEFSIARFKKQQAALLFNSGYTANLGIITALAQREDIVFCDRLNHASIIDGIILSRAEFKRYPHRDMQALKELLKAAGNYKKRIIVTDTVFSMDGDIAPLADIAELAKKYNAIVIADEAHATGVFGQRGSGIAEEMGLEDAIDAHMGTLSKALGGFGAYAAGRKELIEYLINKSRPFIYTTALPPSVAASSIAAIDIVRRDRGLHKQLWRNAGFFRRGLIDCGFDILESRSQIIPIMVGDAALALEFSRRLFERGIFIQAIRPPTVPKGASRLRATIMATHTEQQLKKALAILKEEGGKIGVV